jgi:hypothetical protein
MNHAHSRNRAGDEVPRSSSGSYFSGGYINIRRLTSPFSALLLDLIFEKLEDNYPGPLCLLTDIRVSGQILALPTDPSLFDKCSLVVPPLLLCQMPGTPG